MLKPHSSIGLLSAMSILWLSSPAFADQNIVQSVSGTTRASGENTEAISHTYQSGSQIGDDQFLWQNINAATWANGQGTTAHTQVIQSGVQVHSDGWATTSTQQAIQSADVSSTAQGDWSTTESTVGQYSIQGW